MYDRERKNKSNPKSAIISLVVMALFLLPSEVIAVLVMLAVILVPVFLLVRKALKGSAAGAGQKKQKAQAFDDCPRPVCFHKDKGVHHVKRGREIDPWDRPDIDISKYQRK